MYKITSLRIKIFILIFMILIPIILLQHFRINQAYDAKVERELKACEDLAAAISRSFTNYIKEVWIQESVIGAHFELESGLSTKDMQKYLSKVLEKQDTIKRLNWISTEGVVIASSEPGLIGMSFRERDYVQRILKGEEQVLSNLEISYFNGEAIIPIAKAIKKDGKMIGIISAIIDIDKLATRLSSTTMNADNRFGFVDSNGMRLFISDNKYIDFQKRKISDNSPTWKALDGELVRTYKRNSSYDGSMRMGIDYPIKEIGWACFFTTTYQSVLDSHYKTMWQENIILALVFLITTLFAIIIVNRILRPINNLKSAAQKVMDGDYSIRTNISGKDEIAATAQAFDRMVEGIEQYDKMKTQFFTNLSHELRTPVNVVFASIQLLDNLQHNTDFFTYREKVNRQIKIVRQNCYRLMRLINNLIDISRYDGGFLEVKLGNHNIISIVESITLSVVRYSEIMGITITFDTDEEERMIACDPDMIERIILNLLSNAIKFTPKDGSINVNIINHQDYVEICIKDTGIGIPEDKLNEVFERFKRLESNLNRMHEGSGIGLALVKALVEAHQGEIYVKSELGNGSEFIMKLPAKVLRHSELKENKEMSHRSLVERTSIEFSDIYSVND